MKKYAIGILLLISALLCAIAAGCDSKPKILDAPQNLRVEQNVLIWDETEHASGYIVYFDGSEHETDKNFYDFSYLERFDEAFEVEILALGDGVNFLDSDWVAHSCRLKDYNYGLSYTLTEDGTGYIASKAEKERPLKGDDSDYILYIPDEYEGLPVKEIGSFEGSVKRKTALTVRMPETIEKIGDRAFYNFASLLEVKIPENVSYIGKRAFYKCSSLLQINIPESVNYIERGAFLNCSSLLQIKIPDNVTYIGNAAFADCRSLQSVALPADLKSIEPSVFDGCVSLTQITIPDGVTSIGKEAFLSCSSLQSVTFSDFLEVIGEYAFKDCKKITSFSLPSSLQTIGKGAFTNCTSLQNLKFASEVSVLLNAFKSCTALKEIEFYKGITLGPYCFSECASLTKIDCSSCAFIDSGAFDKCTAISEIKFPKDANTYTTYAFYTTSWYESQPDGYVIVNGDTLFHYKGEIPNNGVIDNFPSQIKQIANNAFGPPLGAVMAPGSNVVSIEIPDGVRLCGKSIFNFCRQLKYVKLPNEITEIPDYTFQGCIALESIEIPEGVTKIGQFAFAFCPLTDIQLPSTLITIESSAFMHCPIKKLYLPDALTNLSPYIFTDSVLEEIILPVSLNTLLERIFTDETIIYYRGTKEQWDEYFAVKNYKGTRYYYSENPPADSGNYWRFAPDGKTPVIWTNES